MSSESYSERLVVPDHSTNAGRSGSSSTAGNSASSPTSSQPAVSSPPPAEAASSHTSRSAAPPEAAAPAQRPVSRRRKGRRGKKSTNTATQIRRALADNLEESSSESENEEDDVFDSPENLDITDQDPRETPPPPPRLSSNPKSTSDPSIQIVRTFWRDGIEQCEMPDGEVLTRYEHNRLVQIATTHEMFAAALDSEFGGAAPVEVRSESESERPGLPEGFEMPPRRSMPERAAR